MPRGHGEAEISFTTSLSPPNSSNPSSGLIWSVWYQVCPSSRPAPASAPDVVHAGFAAELGRGDSFPERVSVPQWPSGNYKTELYDPAMEKYQPSPQWINLFVFVKDPENKNLLARQYGPQGSFTFTSQSPGEHQICLHLESIRFALFYDGKLAIHLDMQLGEHTNDYAEFAAKDKLTQLHLRVQQLVEQVELIQKEQEYQRWREERFRQTSESTNQRVLWWSILQTFILVATGVWQMQHLKSFFKAKKLV
uniref:Transmembrane emp24 domain-containing protein 9-like n=3 Tax=Otariidae TaxID=9702 RepID=A0A3Q7NUC2_CALUR|nr:transmembrane emp24 domain-containing protein 9-like [Callorhinus ursinus]